MPLVVMFNSPDMFKFVSEGWPHTTAAEPLMDDNIVNAGMLICVSAPLNRMSMAEAVDSKGRLSVDMDVLTTDRLKLITLRRGKST